MNESTTSDTEQAPRKDATMRKLAEEAFAPPPWLRNPHLQTGGARYVRQVPLPEVRTERLATPDGDFLVLHHLAGSPGMPTALLLHGLEGSVESMYMKSLLQELQRGGWNAVAMDFRSCSGEMNRARRLYHSGETTDVAFVVDTLVERDPDIELFLAGYSLGGNVTTKWLGEIGEAAPKNVRAAAVVSAPYDLVASGEHMDKTFSRMYVLHFLRMLVPKAVEKEQQYPGCLDIERAKKARTFQEFDDAATALLHGFESAHDYYSSCGCGQFVSGARRPMLLLSAADDPFNPGSTFPWEAANASPWLHPVLSRFGGHVGFVNRRTNATGLWSDRQILRFFESYREHP